MRPDFPYYAGKPVAIRARHWLALLSSVLAGFLLLVLLPTTSWQAQFFTRLLFVGLPLCTLAWVAGRDAKAIFGSFSARDAAVALLAAVLSMLAALGAALVVRQFAPVAPNALAVDVLYRPDP